MQYNELEKTMTKNYAVNPYLFFDGRCEEAIEFYRKTVGAEQLMLMRYKDAPAEAGAQQCNTPGGENKVMHARLRIGGSTILLSDGPCSGKFDGFSLSLTAPSAEDAERSFAALSAGGSVDMPLARTFFSPAFGMLTDRFGVKWMVFVETAT
jgi:PhnB protein